MTATACDSPTGWWQPHLGEMGFLGGNPICQQGQALPIPGVAVDMPDYSMQTDNLLVGVMVGCFILLSLLYRYLRPFLVEQFRSHFFLTPSAGPALEKVETGMEKNARMLMTVMLSIAGGAVYYGVVQELGARFHPMLPCWLPLLAFAGSVLACLVGRTLLKMMVNTTFFDMKNREEIMREVSFNISMETILFFAVSIVAMYGEMPLKLQVIVLVFPIVFVKIHLFFSTYRILFRKLYRCLHFFVYFCATELVPIAILWMFLNKITSNLTVN